MSGLNIEKFKFVGCLEFLGREWNKLFKASQTCEVIQRQSMSGQASMRIFNGKWTLELGE